MKCTAFVLLCLALAVVVGYGIARAEGVPSSLQTSMTGYWNGNTQQICTYPLRSVPSICRRIDYRLLPADIPHCDWSPGQPIIAKCDIIVVQIDTSWARLVLGKE